MRSAENRYGSELNRRSLKKTSVLLADSTRISSIACGFTDSSPRTMLTRVGKKHTSAAIAIFGSMPLPMISTRIGALATTGIALNISTTGKKMSSSVLLCTNSRGDQDRRQVAEQEAAGRLDRGRQQVGQQDVALGVQRLHAPAPATAR